MCKIVGPFSRKILEVNRSVCLEGEQVRSEWYDYGSDLLVNSRELSAHKVNEFPQTQLCTVRSQLRDLIGSPDAETPEHFFTIGRLFVPFRTLQTSSGTDRPVYLRAPFYQQRAQDIR